MNNADPAAMIRSTLVPAMLTTRFLELIILPTEQCNFRCTYCYEDFSIGKMQAETMTGIINLIAKRIGELDHLKIAWFGGEPLSARSVVYEIGEFAHTITRQHGIHYTSSMTTNGFLLNLAVASKLCALGINEFQISLDGPCEVHDKTRLRIDGSGSFKQIWDNLLILKQSNLDFKIMIRIHITPLNYLSLFELINDLVKHFDGDTRFSLFFKAIADLGGPHTKTFTTLKHGEKATAIQKLIDAVDNKIAIISTKQTSLPYVCYAAQANSFVIRANGNIAKCTVALDVDANNIGRLLPDGTLAINQQALQPWLRGMRTLSPGELRCPLNGLKPRDKQHASS